MKKIKIVICLLFVSLMTGCWNYRELNDLAIATAIGVDKDDNGYQVSLLISNAKKSQVSAKEGESQTVVYSDTGKTITEAIRNINLTMPKDVYIGHLSVIVIDEKIAEEGMYPILDYFLREPESVKRFFLILARDNSAKDVLSILSPLEAFPSQNIYFNIKSSKDSQALSPSITYSKFIENILKPGMEPTLPSIIIEGDPDDAQNGDSLQESIVKSPLKLDTVAIFNNDKLLGYGDNDESRGINLVTEEVSNTTVTFKYNNENISLNLAGIKVTKEVDLVNNDPIINISFKSNGAIREITGNDNLLEESSINEIQVAAQEEIKSIIEKGIKCAQKYKSDIFGFGNMLYKKNPHYFEKIKEDWNNIIFPDINVKITTNIDLQTKGSLENTIGGLKNEITS